MIYELKCGKCTAGISTVGAEMVSFKYDGKDVLWTGDPQYWNEHAPILFPVCCRLINGRINIEGKEYKLGLHGFARKLEYEAVTVSDTHIELTAHATEETLKQYPFNFTLTITHDISETGFSTEFKVTNDGDRPMIYCIGAHPGFLTGNIEDWKLVFNKEENAPLYYTTPNECFMDESLVYSRRLTTEYDLKYKDYENDAKIAINPASDSVCLINKNTGKGYRLDFGDFKVFATWTSKKGNAPYICLEPWNGLPAFANETGNFEDKPFAETLQAGESKAVSYSVELI